MGSKTTQAKSIRLAEIRAGERFVPILEIKQPHAADFPPNIHYQFSACYLGDLQKNRGSCFYLCNHWPANLQYLFFHLIHLPIKRLDPSFTIAERVAHSFYAVDVDLELPEEINLPHA